MKRVINTQVSYEVFVAALVKPGGAILSTLTDSKVDAWHNATGVSGEAGELLDAIKKYVVYNKPLDRVNVVEELGDLEFYMEGLRQSLDITREETIVANRAKLQVRYAAGYSDAAAQARADKEPEKNE
jgi:NTP pyrophosphatase (non-canonical NTP hydrolase)